MKNSRRQSIDVHIEELVLHGFAPADRYAIGDAVQQELSRLLSVQGTPNEIGAERNAIDAGAFEVTLGERGYGIGANVAQSVYQGLSQTEPSRAESNPRSISSESN